MPGKPPGWVVIGVLELLEQRGPMTRAAICRALGATKSDVSPVISRLNRTLKSLPRRIYITGYTYEDEGSAIAYPRAVYALGSAPNRPKPPRTPAAEVKRRSAQKAKTMVSSIFEYAMPRRARAAHRQAIREQFKEAA